MVNDPSQLRDPIGYVCPKCRTELYDRYRPFCGECGQEMPPKKKMQAVGLTIHPFRYGQPVGSIEDITAIVNKIGPAICWLEEYHPTFRTTKIRIRTAEDQQSDHELVCTSTIRMELPIGNGWIGTVALKQQAEDLVEVSDSENNVLVIAGSVSLHSVARS